MKKIIEEAKTEVFVGEKAIVPEFRVHEVWVRVTQKLYGRVYYASQNTGVSMSQIGSMCIEKALDGVEREIIKKGKKR